MFYISRTPKSEKMRDMLIKKGRHKFNKQRTNPINSTIQNLYAPYDTKLLLMPGGNYIEAPLIRCSDGKNKHIDKYTKYARRTSLNNDVEPINASQMIKIENNDTINYCIDHRINKNINELKNDTTTSTETINIKLENETESDKKEEKENINENENEQFLEVKEWLTNAVRLP
eukprot:505082_1